MCTSAKDHHLEESANDELLDAREFQLSCELKKLCNDKGIETNIQKSAKVWHQLGRVYQNRASLSSSPDDMFALIRSAVLFKAAIVRKPDNVTEIENDLLELCSHVLMLSGAKHRDVCLTDKAESVMKDITEMREKIKIKLDSMDVTEKLDLQTTEGKQKEIEQIEKLQCEITDWYTKKMKEIMDYCTFVQGTALCEYALIGMGSLAKNEITPYSDFEHAILLEDGADSNSKEILEYFRWVSVIFQLVMVNLGETIPPNINLLHLNNPFDENQDWFFDDYTTRGVSVDGMTPYACKFPLGRKPTPKKPWKVELIRSVSQMLKYLNVEEDLKNGYHLADMLMSTCFVSGNQSVYEVFRDGVRISLKDNDYTEGLKQHIDEDVKNFHPIKGLDEISRKQKWNVKRVVYRSTTLFIAALGKHHKLSSTSSFKMVRKLEDNAFIDRDFSLDLLTTVAIACHTRLLSYFDKGRQDDRVEAAQFDDQFVKLFGAKTAVSYFQIAMKLQRETCNKIGLQDSNYVQIFSLLDKLLASFWLQQWQDAIEEADRIYSNPNCTGERKIVNEVVLTTGYQYYEEERYRQALRCFEIVKAQCSANSSHACEDDLAYCLYWIGKCYLKFGEVEKALKHHEGELDLRLQFKKARRISHDVGHQHLSKSSGESSSNDKVSEPVQRAKDWPISEMCEEISLTRNLAEVKYHRGQLLCRQEKYNKALELHEEALNIKKGVMHHTDTHLERSYTATAACYFNMEKFKDASIYLLTAKLILMMKGDSLLKSNIALHANLLGDCLYEQEKYSDALVHYKEAVDIGENAFDDTKGDETLAEFYHDMGACLSELEDFQDAITWFEKEKTILIQNGNLLRKCAENSNRIGDCLYEQEKYSDALVHYKEAVDIGENTFDGTNGDETLAEFYHDMGACLSELQDFQDAITWFEKEKTILIQNGNLLRKCAENSNRIGDCFYEQGKYSDSLVHYKEAVDIGENAFDGTNGDETLAEFYHDMGACLSELQDFQDAITWFEKEKTILIQNGNLSRKCAENSNCIGDCFYEQGNHSKALVHYTEAVDIGKDFCNDESCDETCAGFRHDLRNCLKKHQDAITCLEEARNFQEKLVGLLWKYADSSNNVGYCFYKLKRYRRAVCYYEEAVDVQNGISEDHYIDEVYAKYCHNLGICLFKLKKFEDAKKYFELAKTVQTSNGDPLLVSKIAESSNWIDNCSRELDIQKIASDYYEQLQKEILAT